MFFDDEDHDICCFVDPNLEPKNLFSSRTLTEDGIPVRKLYVSNLPSKTTRCELFELFAQYGFIKSCWLKMGDRGPNSTPSPAYAFVTFSNPEDAHKALLASFREKCLRGRTLRVSPADSWHQPVEDAVGNVCWQPRDRPSGHTEAHTVEESEQLEPQEVASVLETISEMEEAIPQTSGMSTPQNEEIASDVSVEDYSILDVLNQDCITHILSFVPIRDLIRSERVSKRWQSVVLEHLEGMRLFKTSWWEHRSVRLTTAVLRRVLARIGGTLLRLHIDHHWSALNDRTAHTIAKFCPKLEELKVVAMHTKNWHPLLYGCLQLKTISFISCNKLTDSSLVRFVQSDSSIQSLTVANNTHVTGLFLTGAQTTKLTSLAFYNCYSLQGTVLGTAVDMLLPNLTTLKLDVCPITTWKMVSMVLNKTPKLQELSLSEYTTAEPITLQYDESLCKALSTLTELKILNISRNIYITNSILKQLGQSCSKLESLNVSSCNARRHFCYPGVSDEGIRALSRCVSLVHLDVSYLAALSDGGLAAVAKLPHLERLVARGNAALSASSLALCLASCPRLQEMDVCGSDGVSEELVSAAERALDARPRPLVLYLAGTSASVLLQQPPTHKLLVVNTSDDRSNPHLRPDFVDDLIADSSEETLHLYDSFEDFIDSDDELFMDDMDDYEIYAFGLDPNDLLP